MIEAASPDVLVFVPEGPLRTIPLAVLHDGERFLIERYALASTPGLSLIAATESETVDRVLASGLIDAVQGFPRCRSSRRSSGASPNASRPRSTPTKRFSATIET